MGGGAALQGRKEARQATITTIIIVTITHTYVSRSLTHALLPPGKPPARRVPSAYRCRKDEKKGAPRTLASLAYGCVVTDYTFDQQEVEVTVRLRPFFSIFSPSFFRFHGSFGRFGVRGGARAWTHTGCCHPLL